MGSRQGKHNPILPGWLTDFNYTWPGGRAQAGTHGPRGCSRGKEVIAGGPIPGGFTVKCMCQPPPDSLFPQHPSSAPHLAVWDEKTPLYGVFATTMKAFFFFSFLRIHPCIPKGAFITPCPGCRHLPASDPPVQKGGLVRHMKPAPLDIWTKRSPLAEHEAVLNATVKGEPLFLVQIAWLNGCSWTQLGQLWGWESQALLAAAPGTSTGQSERQVCFRKKLPEPP